MKNWFQSFAFKCNLYRYALVHLARLVVIIAALVLVVLGVAELFFNPRRAGGVEEDVNNRTLKAVVCIPFKVQVIYVRVAVPGIVLQKRAAHRLQPISGRQIARKPQSPIARLIVDFS